MSVDRKRLSERYSVLTAFFCILFIELISADTIRAGGIPESASSAIRSSNLVIIGRVVGLVDQKPAAMRRRAREAHWVDVVRVLKGNNEAGEKFIVRPGGSLWQDGRSYILFLDWRGGNIAGSRYAPVIEATEKNLGAVAREIAQQGAGPLPRRVYWLRHIDGWQVRASTEFTVTENARYVWTRRSGRDAGDTQPEVLRGVLPKSALEALIRSAEGFSKAIAGDDEGTVTIDWRNADGGKQTKILGPLSLEKVSVVLQEIEALARRYQ